MAASDSPVSVCGGLTAYEQSSLPLPWSIGRARTDTVPQPSPAPRPRGAASKGRPSVGSRAESLYLQELKQMVILDAEEVELRRVMRCERRPVAFVGSGLSTNHG